MEANTMAVKLLRAASAPVFSFSCECEYVEIHVFQPVIGWTPRDTVQRSHTDLNILYSNTLEWTQTGGELGCCCLNT